MIEAIFRRIASCCILIVTKFGNLKIDDGGDIVMNSVAKCHPALYNELIKLSSPCVIIKINHCICTVIFGFSETENSILWSCPRNKHFLNRTCETRKASNRTLWSRRLRNSELRGTGPDNTFWCRDTRMWYLVLS